MHWFIAFIYFLFFFRCFLIVGMILWTRSQAPTKSEEEVIQEVQAAVDAHKSLKQYTKWLEKNSPWTLVPSVDGRKWVDVKIKEMKQAHDVELRRRFYGYP